MKRTARVVGERLAGPGKNGKLAGAAEQKTGEVKQHKTKPNEAEGTDDEEESGQKKLRQRQWASS